jgi:hypothetical protein
VAGRHEPGADVELVDEHELGVNIPGAIGIVDPVAGVDTFSTMKGVS